MCCIDLVLNDFDQEQWVDVFRPFRAELTPALLSMVSSKSFSRNSSVSMPLIQLSVDYAADDVTRITELTTVCSPEELSLVLPKLKVHKEKVCPILVSVIQNSLSTDHHKERQAEISRVLRIRHWHYSGLESLNKYGGSCGTPPMRRFEAGSCIDWVLKRVI